MSDDSKNKSDDPQLPWLIRGLVFIVKNVGLPATVSIVVIYTFMLKASDEQISEFIDYWILLKSPNHNYCIMIIIILLLTLGYQNYYFRKLLEVRKQENNRIGRIKTELEQKHLPETDLHTSD